MFLNQVASVMRLTSNVGDNDTEQYRAVVSLTSIPINVQPATAELTALVEGAFGQTYTAFVAVSGILIGDKITVSGYADYYIVRGVRDWFYAPIPHLELVLFKGNN